MVRPNIARQTLKIIEKNHPGVNTSTAYIQAVHSRHPTIRKPETLAARTLEYGKNRVIFQFKKPRK